ncbi:MAG: hypothetical protein HA494_09060 [Thaumarchaeota archaeon]|nr:hypothetical protein [Nitrososphaerota archaeon]
MNKIYTLTSFLVLYALLFSMPIVQVAAESDRHSFAFSARHTFAVPGAAFNTWQGSGLIKDGYASGSGFLKASYLVRGTWREYEADFVFTGGFRFLDSDRLLLDATVIKSTITSFQSGASFQILLIRGGKPPEGSVSYFIPSLDLHCESGSQSPAVVVIN